MKLLLAGDLHIGRTSSRVPKAVSRQALRTVHAWHRMVDLAIDEGVNLLCLCGDIADQANRFYEAIGPLQAGVARLAEAGIRTVAVAGNHDYEAMARLARQLPDEHFTLLGVGGVWQRMTVHDEVGRPALQIDGWSFPTHAVHTDPLDDYHLPTTPGAPTLGLVHGDLDDPTSRYAPLDAAKLKASGITGWLLGHIHAPRLENSPGSPWLLYPGSPQAMDPGEPGTHGVWLCNVRQDTLTEPTFRPISTARYESVSIDLEGIDTVDALDAAIIEGIRNRAEQFVATSPDLACLSLRLRLTGRTSIAMQVDEAAARITADLNLSLSGAMVVVEKVDNATLPVIDLDAHAQSQAPPGALARLLRELDADEPSPQVRQLIQRTRQALLEVDQHRDFAALDRAPVAESEAREVLAEQARRLLTQLVSQES